MFLLAVWYWFHFPAASYSCLGRLFCRSLHLAPLSDLPNVGLSHNLTNCLVTSPTIHPVKIFLIQFFFYWYDLFHSIYISLGHFTDLLIWLLHFWAASFKCAISVLCKSSSYVLSMAHVVYFSIPVALLFLKQCKLKYIMQRISRITGKSPTNADFEASLSVLHSNSA